MRRNTMIIKTVSSSVYFVMMLFFFSFAAAQLSADEVEENALEETAVSEQSPISDTMYEYQITSVQYEIKGITRVYPLSKAVPIDKMKVFSSEAELQEYFENLKQQYKNIRALQSAEILPDYGEPSEDYIIPVTLFIKIKDTWNFIAVPYPSFDSNSGFQVKLKIQDFNFVGTLQPIKADIIYRSTEQDKQIFSGSLRFALPFKAKIFDMLWDTSLSILWSEKYPKIGIGNGLHALYTVNKRLKLGFGASTDIVINDIHDADSPAAAYYPDDRYYFTSGTYFTTPVNIMEIPHFGTLVWVPRLAFTGNWAFDGIQADALKQSTFTFGHALTFGQVDWFANFRKGLSFSLGNGYAYNLYKPPKPDISITTTVAGYYPFVNRVGIYGRMQFFYHFFGRGSSLAGETLRGILNRRITTDTGFAFNLDIPVRIATLDFEKITGVSWTRFFNCDVQLVPFFDFAWVHDKKTGRYYHPADGWYAGGLEVIVFPEKMRSIYVRASVGFDLMELKNVPGINKLKGKAKRDGQPISEIFIGIGVHY